MRRGVRVGRSTVVVHLSEDSEGDETPQVGFVVSKAVGNAVHRNQVRRRLRVAVGKHLDHLPGHARAVVRALPPAASATFDDLARDVGQGLDKAVSRRRATKDAAP